MNIHNLWVERQAASCEWCRSRRLFKTRILDVKAEVAHKTQGKRVQEEKPTYVTWKLRMLCATKKRED